MPPKLLEELTAVEVSLLSIAARLQAAVNWVEQHPLPTREMGIPKWQSERWTCVYHIGYYDTWTKTTPRHMSIRSLHHMLMLQRSHTFIQWFKLSQRNGWKLQGTSSSPGGSYLPIHISTAPANKSLWQTQSGMQICLHLTLAGTWLAWHLERNGG